MPTTDCNCCLSGQWAVQQSLKFKFSIVREKTFIIQPRELVGWRELKGVKGCANKTPFIVRFQSDRGGVGGGGQERVSLI